ncbi:MAG: hypothetical protein Q7Q71_05375 [Verrucomicrobiota bacterium JB023]|nr:hypothetical protein [Verrucomicrobiota bacterium JB023]
MKILIPILLSACFGASLHADAPQKESLNKYRQLWTDSIVTDKPVAESVEAAPVVTPLDDYTLGGWTKTQQGYIVSLMNTKDRNQRIIISPQQVIAPKELEHANFQVLDVRSNPMNFRSGEVLVQVGSQKKWIGYDEKFLVLQKPAAQPRQQQNRNTTRQTNNPTPTTIRTNTNRNNTNRNNNNTQRQPRVRRVPTPPTR